MFKKIVALCCIILFAFSPFSVKAESEKPTITANAYVLYNPDNDEIVESKNQDKKMYPASLTKMMTALAVTKLCDDYREEITVTENSIKSLYGTNSSKAGILKGEIITVEQMLYLMLLPSGNDAALALAEHFTNKGEDFIKFMNELAKSLGMNNSNFVNPHGLHDENHYTTAADLAILADAFMGVPMLCKIAKCREFIMPQTNLQVERPIRTTNYLLRDDTTRYYYKYATGLKTGYTDDAGKCFAGSAEKNGVKYIVILLSVPEVWDRYGLVRTEFLEAAELFKYAFSNYKFTKIAKRNTILESLPVFETRNKTVDLGLKNDIFATIPNDTDLNKIIIDFTPQNLLDKNIADSPVKKGDSFGVAKLMLENRVVGECEVLALNTVEPNALIVFWHAIDFYVYLILGIILFLIFAFCVLIIRKQIVLYRRRKMREKREQNRKRLEQEFLKRDPYNYFKMD
ncbi:MAG: D-alanyl-D-alanine carboxypeptidase [Clostridia bacterium]|nr:D-alanyl-D-alanine carboxypeptidase [Clostridia bacterium]